MSASEHPIVCVAGAGPAGLMAADVLSAAGARVCMLDHMASPARKFLMAGRGGLNLTHSEPFDQLVTRYGAASEALRPMLEAFPPDAVRAWSERLGETTFVGSSGRIFPASFKASPLLRAWLRRLEKQGVQLHTRWRFQRWGADLLVAAETPDGPVSLPVHSLILALGGASWPRLGSTGDWAAPLADRGVAIDPFRPSNCGFQVSWSEIFRSRFAGEPLKGATFSADGRSIRGEATIVSSGIEGSAIYALSATLRDAIEARGAADLIIDLRPDIGEIDLIARLARSRPKDSWTQKLRKAGGLSPVGVGLALETGARAKGLDDAQLAHMLKNLPVRLDASMPLARAISSAGGVVFDELDRDLMLRRAPGVFVCGEMLNYEAPTGGYLLQAALSTGFVAGRGAARRLGLPIAAAGI